MPRILALTVSFLATALIAAPTQAGEVNHYVGALRCDRCHNAAESGKQGDIWRTKKHANALKGLSTPEAKKIAAELGIANPAKDDRCLKCHETGFGKKKSELGKSFEMGMGVQCESCHGPGEKHFRIRFDEQQEEDEFEDEEPELLMTLPRGEVTRITEKMCETCHNKESPTYKPFCFCKRMQEIAHWDPRREKIRGKKALAKLPCGCK